MTQKYFPQEIEKKWQKKWRDEKIFSPDMDKAKKPYYALMMFPYPSAEGLHVGNMYPFTAVDIVAHFKRMQGYDVFEPIGLDAFGIHSENYAIKQGKHPAELTEKTGKRFYEQLSMTGNSYDWSRTLETHKPEYYKWTQWIFIQLYRAGLAERREASVNWCPSCKTVLADEQVIAGACERCGTQVIQKELKQWFFKITEFADKLLENLSAEIWSERIRGIQKNWIGKSEGVELDFKVIPNDSEGSRPKATNDASLDSSAGPQNDKNSIKVFTTALDTVFGVTFVVLAPEHPLVEKLTIKEQKKVVDEYVKRAVNKSDLERQENKEKTGVLTGSFAINPFNGENVPVWIADYVLMGYGTGAVMAVPGHDARDHEFAQKFSLEIKPVVRPKKGVKDARVDKDNFWDYPEIKTKYSQNSELFDSGQFDGLSSIEGKRAMENFIEKEGFGKRKSQYHLRDWLISRQRYWGPPIPIIYCEKCGTVPVPEEELPVVLPETDNFRPTGTGKSPLASIDSFVNTVCPTCGGKATRETDVSDNFLDSAWYFFRYTSTEEQKNPWIVERVNKWLPVDIYIGGFEHAVLHLMYTRFITMAFKKIGLIDFEEPFKKFVDNGHILAEGMKMSKSKGNVINPDDYIKEYGADTLRMYLMFLGPLTDGGDFRKDAIGGIYRFLQRVWKLSHEIEQKPAGAEEKRILNKTIEQVTADLETVISLNTPIARLMELVNFLFKQGSADPETIKTLLKLLAPFAPHIAEELWQESETLNVKRETFESIHFQEWPNVDHNAIKSSTLNIPVQIDGKFRGLVTVSSSETAQNIVVKKALEIESVKKHLEGRKYQEVYIEGKVLNLVLL